MIGSTYLKLASAAREFAAQDDAYQAIEPYDDEFQATYRTALSVMPEVVAEVTVMALNLTRCAMVEAMAAPFSC